MSKTILITGASSGIGKATAYYFLEKGWNVCATMRNPELKNGLHESDNIIYPHLDVTDIESIKDAMRVCVMKFGGIDVLVNNAAYNLTGPFEGATPEQILSLYAVDVFGVMNVTREIIPHFREQNKGMIINVTSLGGLIGMPLSSFYASAKWAVEGFSESLRYELKKLGIHVKVVEPGGVKTEFANNTVIVHKKEVKSYEDTIKKRLAAYEKRRDRLSDPKVIAEVIFQAANEGNDRLRYLAGNDAKLIWFLKKVMSFSQFTRLLNRLAG